MLWGRVTYVMMESYWPAVARGGEVAPPAMREWAVSWRRSPAQVRGVGDSQSLPGTTATAWRAICERTC
jgi:hypothetical protein